MILRNLFITGGLFSVLCTQAIAQRMTEQNSERYIEAKGNVITGGPEAGLLIPTGLFAAGSVVTNNTEQIRFGVRPLISYRFGATVRFDLVKFKKMKLSNMFSFTTGLYYTQRRFRLDINDVGPNAGDSLLAGGNFNFVSYEIPLLPHLHLQASDRLWLHFGIGLGLEFFPSHIYTPENYEDIVGKDGGWYYYGAKKFLVIPNAKIDFGLEWRTEKAGYFSLGATFQRPFPYIMDGFVEYWRTRDNETYAVYPYGQKGEGNRGMNIVGQFFAVNLRYYIPPSKGLKDTTPDWIKDRQKDARKKRRQRIMESK